MYYKMSPNSYPSEGRFCSSFVWIRNKFLWLKEAVRSEARPVWGWECLLNVTRNWWLIRVTKKSQSSCKDLYVQKYESNTYYWVEGGWDFWGTDSMMETQWPQKKTLLTYRYSTTKARFIYKVCGRNLPVSVFFFFKGYSECCNYKWFCIICAFICHKLPVVHKLGSTRTYL